MPTLTTRNGVNLHYTDSGGDGRPLVLIHGWPLSGESFAANIPTFVGAGYRVVTYDRRGFGQSDKPQVAVDYDELADDLAVVLEALDLRDAVLLGFSMGGGEVARFLGRHDPWRIAGAIFSGAITPALCITDDNPDGGMPFDGFTAMAESCRDDRDGFLDSFITTFFSNDSGIQVSENVRAQALRIAHQSDPVNAVACILLWATDLRRDCEAIKVPTLVVHGTQDQNVPFPPSAARMKKYIPQAEVVPIEGGPHGANLSHKEEWEKAILDFLAGLS